MQLDSSLSPPGDGTQGLPASEDPGTSPTLTCDAKGLQTGRELHSRSRHKTEPGGPGSRHPGYPGQGQGQCLSQKPLPASCCSVVEVGGPRQKRKEEESLSPRWDIIPAQETQKPVQQPEPRPLAPLRPLTETPVWFLVFHPHGHPGFGSSPSSWPPRIQVLSIGHPRPRAQVLRMFPQLHGLFLGSHSALNTNRGKLRQE